MYSYHAYHAIEFNYGGKTLRVEGASALKNTDARRRRTHGRRSRDNLQAEPDGKDCPPIMRFVNVYILDLFYAWKVMNYLQLTTLSIFVVAWYSKVFVESK